VSFNEAFTQKGEQLRDTQYGGFGGRGAPRGRGPLIYIYGYRDVVGAWRAVLGVDMVGKGGESSRPRV
jgi:hypothetical protein